MAEAKVTPARDAEHVRLLLDVPEVRALVRELDDARWTGRTGYGSRALVGMAFVKAVYALPTWTRTVRLVRDHAALRGVRGLDRVRVHADLTILARLATALAKAKAVPLAA